MVGTTAWAGRPLSVDDAGVNDKGAGHVELWMSRTAGKVNTLNVAPAFAPIDNLELAAVLSRDTTNRATLSAIQAKWRITPSQEKGCNVAASLGFAHVNGGGGNATNVNSIFSCNGTALGNVHLNLGGSKPSGASLNGTWGVALEKELGGLTPHVEWFGAEGAKPTLQLGARTEISKGIQLDGTIGRTAGETLYSLGFKIQF